ncbi:MAG: PilZ domain-containing protein [Myxococcota bacterium]
MSVKAEVKSPGGRPNEEAEMAVLSADLDIIRVEFECPHRDPPLRIEARLTAFSRHRCAVLIASDDPPQLATGTQVELTVVYRRELKVEAIVEQQVGREVELRNERIIHPDQRYFARENAGIELHWKPVADENREASSQAWQRGIFALDDGWNTPHPFVNFSASGLRFRDQASCSPGDIVLVAFRLPDEDQWRRARASVVRTEPGDDGQYDIAVAFEQIEEESVEALATFALDRQMDELVQSGVLGQAPL